MSNITFSEISADAVASGTLIEQQNVKRQVRAGILPRKILLLGQYNDGKTPDVTKIHFANSLSNIIESAGRGSMLHLMAEAAFANKGAVELYYAPIADNESAVKATGNITITGTATGNGVINIYIAGIRVQVAVATGDTQDEIAEKIDTAITANLNLPVESDVDSGTLNIVDLTCKWGGESGNQITVRASIETSDVDKLPAGVTISTTDMEDGALDPTIDSALALMGNTWYTDIVCPYTSDTVFTTLNNKGESRQAPHTKKMFVSYIGYNDTRSNFLTYLTNKNTKWVSTTPVPKSESMPLQIAAAVSGQVARSAQIDPARPFTTLPLVGIRGGSEDWEYLDRDQVVKAGGSTTITDVTGTPRIEDLVTTYTSAPDGTPDAAWRFVETITNIQAKIYQLDVLFSGSIFARALVVDDTSTCQKEYAIRPKTVKSFAIPIIDNWIAEGWSKNRDDIVDALTSEPDPQNPGRINILFADVIAAGKKIMAVKYEWDFNPAS